MRNSGQYWKALGVISSTRPIKLTNFGKKVCVGEITPSEFSATVIKTLTLPNVRIGEDVSKWEAKGLLIKPLELILDILAELYNLAGKEEAYLTAQELTQIVIPLAGAKSILNNYTSAILAHRKGALNVSSWVDCTPESNDKRMAKEFLLFLCHYGYIEEARVFNPVIAEFEYRFQLMDVSPDEISDLATMPDFGENELDEALVTIRASTIPDMMDRRRVSREMVERPGQKAFRKQVFKAALNQCAITGASLEPVLQAAHIIPAARNGADDKSNGLCLRSDIHILFDNGLLRLHPTGDIQLASHVTAEKCYSILPKKIVIPRYVNPANLDWRIKYT